MDYATIAAWGCNTIVILGVGSYIVFEILKRWRADLGYLPWMRVSYATKW